MGRIDLKNFQEILQHSFYRPHNTIFKGTARHHYQCVLSGSTENIDQIIGVRLRLPNPLRLRTRTPSRKTVKVQPPQLSSPRRSNWGPCAGRNILCRNPPSSSDRFVGMFRSKLFSEFKNYKRVRWILQGIKWHCLKRLRAFWNPPLQPKWSSISHISVLDNIAGRP